MPPLQGLGGHVNYLIFSGGCEGGRGRHLRAAAQVAEARGVSAAATGRPSLSRG